MNQSYDDFIASKIKRCVKAGFEPKPIKAPLFDWQKSVVRWALRTGRCALFEECIDANTIITGTGRTVAELAICGTWFDVIARKYGLAFKAKAMAWANGYGQLFEITLSDGSTIEVSAGHRLFTKCGWKRFNSISVGEQLSKFVPCPLASSGEFCQSIHVSDELHSSKTAQDLRYDYSPCYHPYDEPPLSHLNTDQFLTPSQDDVPGRIPSREQKDVFCIDGRYIHHHPHIDRLTMPDWHYQPEMNYAADVEYPGETSSLRPTYNGDQVSEQCQWPSHHYLPAIEQVEYPNPKRMISGQFSWATITAIRKTKQAILYDLFVPGYENYLANDIWNHNCGLGKTLQQLEWARQVSSHTEGNVLILTPLAVAHQTASEAKKFGIKAHVATEQKKVKEKGIWITNYEKLDRFDPSSFSGVVLDESSVLKSFQGKTRKELTDAFSKTPYRLCCTATPSPNDYTELGQHADFLGVCTQAQMLATYFINDTFNTGDWRLKRHAATEFWKWVASWACCVTKPSDIGFSDEGYNLPKLNMYVETVDVDETVDSGEELFRHATLSATTMHREMRMTSEDRAKRAAQIINKKPKEQWLVWCNTNDEADHLIQAIPGCTEVRGSDSERSKEDAVDGFLDGRIRVLISKPSMFGHGLNLQCCANMIFVGLSYSFEEFYQALRRSYRFGQTKETHAYIIQAQTEGAILQAIEKKISQHETMQKEMKQAAAAFDEGKVKELKMNDQIILKEGRGWTVAHADCVRFANTLADESIDFSVFSPPFADLFTYSDDLQDMGNSADISEFTKHFEILIAELARIMVPGRQVAVHCADLLSTKWKHGKIEFQDFSGEIIRAFWKHKFLFHSRICIWKSPVTEMQRTKAHGLLYKSLKADSTDCRVGCADYLLIFRKPGENPKPVTKDPTEYPVDWWQEVASPVWMTVDQARVLNGEGARDQADERHICPLQLDVIERAITLWTNPGDIVYSPFAGIGSEGYGALKLGRKFTGSELKKSYFELACSNLHNATAQLELSEIIS